MPAPVDAGAQFFRTRDAALSVLDAIEAQIAPLAAPLLSTDSACKPAPVHTELERLAEAAQQFLDDDRDPTDERMATAFCRECLESDPAAVVRNLVKRDDRVLRLVGNDVRPGVAFSGQSQAQTSEEEDGLSARNAIGVPIPADISDRVHNLYLLELDLHGRLGKFLNPPMAEEAA